MNRAGREDHGKGLRGIFLLILKVTILDISPEGAQLLPEFLMKGTDLCVPAQNR